MSIIHNALKKTDVDLQGTNKILKHNETSTHKFKEPQIKQKIKKSSIILPLILLTISFVVAFFIITQNMSQKTSTTKISRPFQKIRTKRVSSKKSLNKPLNKYGLTLGGIMQLDNKYVALINDEVYHVGEFINKKEVLSISLKEVILKELGELITLNVH